MRRLVALAATVLLVLPIQAHAAFRGANGPLVTAAGERLWLYEPDGSPLRSLSIKGARTPDLAPDSRWIVFAKGGDLAKVRANGTRLRWLTNDDDTQELPTWSPDGHHILYIENGAIFSMQADGSDVRRIGEASAYDAEWSPDGRTIAFVGCAAMLCTTADLYVMNGDGTQERLVASTPNSSEMTVDWSPDGLRLVAQCGEVSRNQQLGTIPPKEICVYDAAGGEPEVIYDDDLRAVTPVWSPSGRRIAFVAKPPGEDDLEVFTLRPDGSDLTRLSYNGHKDMTPDWGPR